MGSQQFCLRWNNHQTNMLSVFGKLLTKEAFVDVTIACEGSNIKAHKVILSACSPFFEDLFVENPCKHPIVIMKDVKFNDLKAIIEFMYKGEVNVSQDKLTTLLKTAETLKIKGLTEMLGDQFEQDIINHNSIDHTSHGNFISSTTTSPASSSKSTHKRKKRKHSGDNKHSGVCQSPPSETLDEHPRLPSTAKDMVQSSQTSTNISFRHDNNMVNSCVPVENSSELSRHLLDPSSFMQQSLTENPDFGNQQEQDVSDEDISENKHKDESNTSQTSLLSANECKVVKQEKQNSSNYREGLTHILPQAKQELVEHGESEGSNSASNTTDELDMVDSNRDAFSPTIDVDSLLPPNQPIESYSDSGLSQTQDIKPQIGPGGTLISLPVDNYDSSAGPSSDPSHVGRSHGSGPRFHASVIANILFKVSGTVCPLCYRNFSSKMSLVRHVRCIHTDLDSIKKHECHLCNKSYVRKDKLHDHLASAHQLTPPGKLPKPSP